MTSSDADKKKDKFDKRAASLRANLQRRKAQTRRKKDADPKDKD
jgi:hypothetical protein